MRPTFRVPASTCGPNQWQWQMAHRTPSGTVASVMRHWSSAEQGPSSTVWFQLLYLITNGASHGLSMTLDHTGQAVRRALRPSGIGTSTKTKEATAKWTRAATMFHVWM